MWFVNKSSNLTLKLPITTIVICFVICLWFLQSLFANSVDPDQTAPLGAVWSGSTLFTSMLNRFEKFARIFSRPHKQTTFSDTVFLAFYWLRVCKKNPYIRDLQNHKSKWAEAQRFLKGCLYSQHTLRSACVSESSPSVWRSFGSLTRLRRVGSLNRFISI